MKELKDPLKPEHEPQQPGDNFLIVGIGASAGGIKALQAFFEQVPAGSGAAYVVILHLSPDHNSQLAQVLQATARIPVTQVTEKVVVAPNRIYVVPPNRHLLMEDGHLAVLPNTLMEERRAPVDIFFRTLADSHGPRTVCVVLSGTGANGSMGLKRVKERGGAAFVQNPREAAFNEMPRNAISTELVDDVLNVADIPAKIYGYKEGLDATHIHDRKGDQSEGEQQALHEIFTQLRQRTGHDFSSYKRPTMLRRIERRMSVQGLADLAAYTVFVRQHPDELVHLLKDLLISVTNFFRDRKAFEALEAEVIPQLFKNVNNEAEIRIWIAGCATGEEAYSIAMLCAEQADNIPDAPKIQVFATDIDEAAIARAREGFYTLNDAADVSPERLRRFFTKDGDGYRINREIRETILFANHNFIKDPPFSRIDLVSCRNVLIYLNAPAQQRVMETFHFSLRPGGYLFLGTAENADTTGGYYALFNREQHIYQARAIKPRFYPVPDAVPTFPSVQRPLPQPATGEAKPQKEERITYGDLHQRMLEQFAPPSLVVNEEYEIVHITKGAGRYLQMDGGELSRSLFSLIRQDIRLELRSAVYQAVQGGIPVEARGLKVSMDDHTETVNVHVRPVLEDDDVPRGFILIVFEPAAGTENGTHVLSAGQPVAQHLEGELVRLKTQLRASNEQHEFQAEELKATNEELQAMNEELRSSTEELETGKEELQSINEELRTVNQELKVKIEEASLISNNLQNLINSTNIGTIFLDRSLRVALFTPPARDLFNLIPSDRGRPLTDITSSLEYAGLIADAEKVLEKLIVTEREVRTSTGNTYLMRLSPYRTEEDRIAGVVITFFDVTERRRNEDALRQSEEKYRTLFESIDEGFCLIEILQDASGRAVDWRFLEVNEAYLRHTGQADPSGRLGSEVTPGAENYWLDIYDKIARTGEAARFENYHRDSGRWYHTYAARVGVSGSRQVAIVFDDITERKLEEQRREFLLNLADALRPLTDPVAFQEVAVRMLGTHLGVDRCYYAEFDWARDVLYIHHEYTQADALSAIGTHPISAFNDLLVHSHKGDPLVCDSIETHPVFGKEAAAYRERGTDAFILVPLVKQGTMAACMCVTMETPRKWFPAEVALLQETAERTWAAVERARAEEALRESHERTNEILDSINDAFYAVDKNFDFTYVNSKAKEWWNKREEDLVGKNMWSVFPGISESDSGRMHVKAQQEYTSQRYETVSPVLKKWVDVSIYPDKHGGLSVYFRDISERKKAEEALRESEDRLRTLADSVPQVIWANDADGVANYFNRRWYEYSGLSFEESFGLGWQVIVHPDDAPASKEQWQQALATQTVFDTEYRLRGADGNYRWFIGRNVPLKEADGRVTGWFGSATDIHDLKMAEEALRVGEERYRVALQSAHMGAWDWNVVEDKIRWNDQHFLLLGLKPEDRLLDAAFFMQFIHPEDLPAVSKELMQAVEETGVYQADAFRVVRVDGEVRWMSGYGRAVSWEDGKAARMVGVMFDITARKQLEEQKDQFIGIASHELRTPVTSIKAYAEILEEMFQESGDTGSVEMMQRLDEQVDRLTSLIYALLDTTRVTGGKLQLEKTDFSMEELIADTAETMQRIAEGHRIELQLGGGATVHGDRERIRQVLVNLMSNAIKYSPGADRIIVQSAADERELTVCVQDFGIGISEGAQRQLFNRFFREKEASSFSGLGLGLFISAGIVREHGGSIRVKSRQGEGALFCFTLPLTAG